MKIFRYIYFLKFFLVKFYGFGEVLSLTHLICSDLIRIFLTLNGRDEAKFLDKILTRSKSDQILSRSERNLTRI